MKLKSSENPRGKIFEFQYGILYSETQNSIKSNTNFCMQTKNVPDVLYITSFKNLIHTKVILFALFLL